MLGGAVETPTPGAEGIVFGDREAGRVWIAPAVVAPVEVVPSAVVFRVVAPPLAVRRQRQQRAESPEKVVGVAGAEEGSMAAVVLNYEGPHRQRRRGDAQREQRPPA